MPRYCHVGASYGCGHHAEHVAAAKKGWRTRRGQGQVAALRRSESILSDLYGERVTQAHTHKSHPNEVRYRMGGKWYRASKAEYLEMVREGAKVQRENKREQARIGKERLSDEKRKLRETIQEKRYRDAMNRIGENEQTHIYAGALKTLRKRGISPSRHEKWNHTRHKILPVDYGEWETLPKSMRRRTGGYSFDGAIEVLHQEGVITAGEIDAFDHNDFLNLFDKMTLWKRDMAAARRNRREDIAYYQDELRKLRAGRSRDGTEEAA